MESNLVYLQNFFTASGDEIFVCDTDGNILFQNAIAQKTYPKIQNINQISHLFNFEVCILKSEDILSYTPISAGVNSSENFTSEAVKQLNENLFAQYTITTFNYLSGQKVFILRNDTNTDVLKDYAELETEKANLENKMAASRELTRELENRLLRTKLINLVSEKVQKYISTEKILNITLEQLKKTLDIESAEFQKDAADFKINFQTDEFGATMMNVPIYLDKKIYGAICLYKKAGQNWQADEVELIKSVCAILSTAYAKEELYNEIENQKRELENALAQLKQAQLQIIQSEKMASLGQLVAGVAHEINTPLGAIINNSSLLSKFNEKTSDINDLKNFINEILPINSEALRRIDKMVKTLKNFARLDEAQKKKADLNEGLKSTILLLNHELKNKISLKENYSRLPMIMCYPDSINQVFMNILLNSCQSIKEKGTITVETKTVDDNIVISISDTGEGIPKENLDKIFEFGFTTKKFGAGTGLGLALSKKIIEEHSGKIEAVSEVGKGTTFTITLPIL